MNRERERELGRLEDRLAFIRARMETIRAEGLVAPPRTWIQKFVVPKKNGKKYYYYRLMEADARKSKSGSIQGKLKLYLGNKHNPKYHTYKGAIRRRNELQELQRRYDRLMKLYEKLLAQPVSCGFEEELEEVGVRGAISTQELVKAIEGIQETVGQLCSWVERLSSLVSKVIDCKQESLDFEGYLAAPG